MGVGGARHSRETVDAVTALWKEGHSGADIARQLGLASRSAVLGIIRRAGLMNGGGGRKLQPRRAPANPHRRAALKAARPPSRSELIASIATVGIRMEDVRPRGQCKWPLWGFEETGRPDFLLCGAACDHDAVYCAGHGAIAGAGYGARRVLHAPSLPGQHAHRVAPRKAASA